ncbi:MAG: metalloregulator ArsR/SmtB family transcription factor [Hyphomicrobiaceae bacterium]|nr:MAG: metalloregulator ArsR/SmtB family transcription factor [Hyphomicrobiaceae bacterium]
MEKVSRAEFLAGMKAAGESTRLRILVLLSDGELTVKDLTRILGQSQPRISRHLKLLTEANLIERFREGSWVYFRMGDGAAAGPISRLLAETVDPQDAVLSRDRERAEVVKRERAEAAQAYFRDHAAEWDEIRSLHVAEEQVEQAILEVAGDRPYEFLVDLGTGTGRMLELLSSRVRRGIGIDINQAMLAYARGRLERAGVDNCRVRLGDLFDVPVPARSADLVVIHQVLHFLSDPAVAIREAARLLRSGGSLLVVDFAPHELEFLRDSHQHQRLGFAAEQISQWMGQAGLELAGERNLVPPSSGGRQGKLTVSLWLGRAKAASEGRTGNLEIAA